MASGNTEYAIQAFKNVLGKEYELCIANKNLSGAVLLIPEVEVEYYNQRTEELRKMYEGRDCQD